MREIIEKIKETIMPLMSRWEEDMFIHIGNLQQYCQIDVYKENPGADVYKIHKLKSNRGWTGIMNSFFGRSINDLKAKIKKEAEAKISKIDIAVAKKLKKIEVKKVELIGFTTNGKDYYCEGAWRINDEKVFSFRTIYAGGYNVQCLHIRTLYTFK